MSHAPPTAAFLRHARRSLPRYTSYPTALAFQPAEGDLETRRWMAGVRATDPLSVYVHVPFCSRLCWYCACNTSVAHGYARIEAYVRRLLGEIDLAAGALGSNAGARHLHFGGGSPNALTPQDFVAVTARLKDGFDVHSDAEIAAELDPGTLTDAFIDAAAEAGVTRVSLGVQTFDPDVQRKVNRIQPFEVVAHAVERLRSSGIRAINFDLMYGLPGQTPEIVAESARAAMTLRPDRLAVFGYAHVPWAKRHQTMISEAELADETGRWAQADAAEDVLILGGYQPIGLDHYALPDDALTKAASGGRLRRNFQGYTDDDATTLVPIGASAIGQYAEGFVQNHTPTDAWGHAVDRGRLPIAKIRPLSGDDRLRAAIIERLMCDLTVDAGAVCLAHGAPDDALDGEIFDAAQLEADGLCTVAGRRVTATAAGRRLIRAVAACFDADYPRTQLRHARAV